MFFLVKSFTIVIVFCEPEWRICYCKVAPQQRNSIVTIFYISKTYASPKALTIKWLNLHCLFIFYIGYRAHCIYRQTAFTLIKPHRFSAVSKTNY